MYEFNDWAGSCVLGLTGNMKYELDDEINLDMGRGKRTMYPNIFSSEFLVVYADAYIPDEGGRVQQPKR